MEFGTLFLAPNTLGDTPPLEVIPLSIKKQLEEYDVLSLKKKKQDVYL